MSILAFLQIFESYWNSAVLYFFPGSINFRTFALIIAIVSAVLLVRELLHRKFIIRRATFIVVVCSIALVALYSVTSSVYGTSNAKYSSFLLAIAGQLVPGIITATFISDSTGVQIKFKKIVPLVATILTFVAAMGVFFPTSATTGGYTDNENGLNYQTASYVAAYMSALFEFCLLTKDEDFYIGIIKSKFGTLLLWIMILLDAVVVMLAGGRGGFVALVFFALLSVFFALKKEKITIQQIIKGIGIIIMILIVGIIAVKYVMNSSLSTSGFSRILSLLAGSGDTGRSSLRMRAIEAFKESPVIGHGMGSVFYEMGEYSHNFFTDILVETGIVGIIVVLFILVLGARKAFKMMRIDYSNIIWMYIFACGFVMSMFSGYWLTHFPLWWGLIFILTYKMPQTAFEEKDG